MVVVNNQTRDEAMTGLFRSLIGFGRATRTLAGGWAIEQPGISRADVVVLGILSQCGSCRPSALAEHVNVGPSVISRQLAHLQSLGLVARTSDPEDGRAGLLSLTEAGRERLLAARAAYVERLAEHLAGWDDAKLESAVALINELNGLLAAGHQDSQKKEIA